MSPRNAARPRVREGHLPHDATNLRAAAWLLAGIDRCGWLGVLLIVALIAVLAFMASGVALVSLAITAASP